MSIDLSLDAGGDAEAGNNSGLLSLFAKFSASVDGLTAAVRQMSAEQAALAHEPVSTVLIQGTSGAATQIVDFGCPQPGREWVVRLLTAFNATMTANAAQVTWYVGQNIPTGIGTGILQPSFAIWQFPSVPGMQNFTSDVIHIKPNEHLLAGITGGTGTPVTLRANVNDEILYDTGRLPG